MTDVRSDGSGAAGSARVPWADHARGIAILLVVLGHTLSGAREAGVLAWSPGAAAVYDVIYSFHMAVFFFVSGALLPRSLSRPDFVAQKVRTLLYPYVLWSGLHGLIGSYASSGMNEPVTFTQAMTGLVTAPVAQFWFLLSLFAMSVACGWARRQAVASWMLVVIASGLWLLVFVPPVFDAIGPVPRSLARYGIYFTAGILFGEATIGASVPRIALSAAVSLCAVGVWSIRTWYLDPRWSALPATLGIIAVVGASMSLGSRCLPLQRLGRWSLAIYLGHVIAAAATRVALLHLGVTSVVVHLLLGVLIGVGAPALLGWARDRGWFEVLFMPPNLGYVWRLSHRSVSG